MLFLVQATKVDCLPAAREPFQTSRASYNLKNMKLQTAFTISFSIVQGIRSLTRRVVLWETVAAKELVHC
jgi:hypothetical protein